MLEFYPGAAEEEECNKFLAEYEEQDDQKRVLKAASYFDASRAAVKTGNRERARRLLIKGVRAAITYDYRKDTTVWTFIEGLAIHGSELGDDLTKYVAQAASCLETLCELTDLDHLDNTGSELVVAVACSNPTLALSLAKQLTQRTGNALFRHGVLPSLRHRGLGNEIEQMLKQNEIPMGSVLDERTSTETAHFPSETLADLLDQYKALRSDVGASYEKREMVRSAIIERIHDADSLQHATSVLLARSPHSLEWAYFDLAKVANRIGLRDDARQLVKQAVEIALNEDRWYWDHARISWLSLIADVDSELALTVLHQTASRTCKSNPEFFGHWFVEAMMRVLHKAGKRDEALAVFHAFAAHMKDLLAPYPDLQPEWESLLETKTAPNSH